MKIGAISDIHIDKNSAYPVTEVLAQTAAEKELDCLLLAGDISNHHTTTLAFLERLGGLLKIPFYFVPGNHDLWDEDEQAEDAREIYRRYAAHPACLVGKCISLDAGWAVVGETGWYDYSFGNARFTRQDFEKHNRDNRTWMDSVNVRWHNTDCEVNRNMLARLGQRLEESKGKKLIAVTHMVGHRAFLVPEARPNWDYFNAFLGSAQYGTLYQKYGVEYAIMGHVHFRKAHAENHIRYLCACLNYFTEWETDSLKKEIESALCVFTV